jgi:hypothetical protein
MVLRWAPLLVTWKVTLLETASALRLVRLLAVPRATLWAPQKAMRLGCRWVSHSVQPKEQPLGCLLDWLKAQPLATRWGSRWGPLKGLQRVPQKG